MTVSASTGRTLRLNSAEFYACWDALGLGETPMLLQLRPPGYTMADYRRLIAQAISELRRRQLYTTTGPIPALARLLSVLARPEYTIDIRFVTDIHFATDTQRQVLGLGAITGPHASVVITDGTGTGPLALQTLDSAHVAAHLLTLVGPLSPARSPTVNIPADTLEQAAAAAPDGDIWRIAENLQTRGVPHPDATSWARMCSNIQAGGQLGATGHFNGPPRRGPWVIAFHRNPAGHFMQLRRRYTADAHTLTVAPADTATLIRHWRELVEHLPSLT